MEESAEQAIQIGVNTFIFIVALSIAVTLLIGVRDVAEKAIELDASIPKGSRVLVTHETNRKVQGYELVSYFTNYISDDKEQKSGKYKIIMENRSGTKIDSDENTSREKIVTYLKRTLNLSKYYEILVEEHNSSEGYTVIKLKEI
ncbi:MAG: hypothetical protein PHR25_02625 [Clostridia bacterium]|nr:hypothetical protein [Clostridia bacterium]MDD4375654.1 hypothetical protein [Clostridia bacterium]